MKTLATLALLAVLVSPALAAVAHDEAIDGDLSSDPLNPTELTFQDGGNTIIGTIGNVGSPADVRDYITFTVPPGHVLGALDLLTFAPDNLCFASFNSGAVSAIPSGATNAFFLSGIHISALDLGTDLMPRFVDRSVTTNTLPSPVFGPGTYCFLIQQTSGITSSYSLEFHLDGALPTRTSTWGVIKRLYR